MNGLAGEFGKLFGPLFDVRDGRVSDRTVWVTNLNSYPIRVNEAIGDILVNADGGTKV